MHKEAWMEMMRSIRMAAMLFLVAVIAFGCAQLGGKQEYTKKSGVGPGMNAKGEVVDSKLVESGYGQHVKGLGDWEGEITGKSTGASKFTKLKIGMSMRQVTDLVGQPTDQGSYVTGKAFIPFYYGGDSTRFAAYWKGQGRVIFQGGNAWGAGRGKVVRIEYDPGEDGYADTK